MIYALLFSLLLILLLGYFKVADHYNIIDKPNHRSSHTAITIRGGGVVYPFAILLYAIFFQNVSYILVAGIVMISAVSFWDDVQNLPNKVRLLVHLLSVTALLISVNAFQEWPLWLLPIVYILVIGTINAYNFMDGINGITGVYSLIALSTFLYVNSYFLKFTDSAFILTPIIASIVFLYFNFRKRAKCFAGDVGSVSIGFWIIALVIMLIMHTGELKYILFLAIYGVDSVLTIMHRLLLKQNIFEAHRLHFYQVLVNDKGISHLTVASGYGTVQLIINAIVLFTDLGFFATFAIVCLPLVLTYLLLKPQLMLKNAYN